MTWKRSVLVVFVLLALAAAWSLWIPMASETQSASTVAAAPSAQRPSITLKTTSATP